MKDVRAWDGVSSSGITQLPDISIRMQALVQRNHFITNQSK
jgi:hypothetical protein